ncbi:LysR family transcriptional regulator [Janthinobacterium sp. 17J80-10]|uniref:LysR family transcriptional regulator n=1 Tax=Janthinobacterium sp. 17J80-10 TaxID=2497863 RepID=UPI00100558F1|nr:LysR family transcriptional regulator [Janthinobacterium sp. 17J80-10]QAU32889.1 LysR family transcriptional regulator [Janthinobacterium sp. 17J80-10]
MDPSQLRAFITVARTGNLTRAAAALHLTQPAVSLQIKALQATLQVQLFSRTPTGMVLTTEGAKLLPLAERILANMAELEQAANALHTTLSGTLAIGTILDPEFTRLGVLLKHLVESWPQLTPRLQHGISGTVLNMVKSGELDVGYFIGDPGKECHSLILTSFTYNVVAPSGWKSRVSGKDWPALAQLPWIWTPPESAHNRLLSNIFSSYQVKPITVAQVDQEQSMLDLVKSGLGLSLVRESIALRESHAHGLVIADAVSVATELRFITLAKRQQEVAIAAVFSLLASVWNR